MRNVTDPVDLAVDALAVYRLTVLVTEDYLTRDLRELVIRGAYLRAGEIGHLNKLDGRAVGELPEDDEAPPKLAKLVTCPWCSSVWLAAGVVAVSRVAPRQWRYVARGLAFSAVAGIIGSRV